MQKRWLQIYLENFTRIVEHGNSLMFIIQDRPWCLTNANHFEWQDQVTVTCWHFNINQFGLGTLWLRSSMIACLTKHANKSFIQSNLHKISYHIYWHWIAIPPSNNCGPYSSGVSFYDCQHWSTHIKHHWLIYTHTETHLF